LVFAKRTAFETMNLDFTDVGQADIEIEHCCTGPAQNLPLRNVQASPDRFDTSLADQLGIGDYQQPPKIPAVRVIWRVLKFLYIPQEIPSI
jgi:hypothetical protein